jgi:hypothetical protein
MMWLWEKIVYGSSLWLSLKVINILPQNFLSSIGIVVWRLLGQDPSYKTKTDNMKYKNILEVFEKVDPLRGIHS